MFNFPDALKNIGSGLVSAWFLEEQGGTNAIDAFGSFDLFEFGTNVIDSALGIPGGSIGSGRHFKGGDEKDSMTVNGAGGLDGSDFTEGQTLLAWVNLDNLTGGTILSKGISSSDDSYHFGWNITNQTFIYQAWDENGAFNPFVEANKFQSVYGTTPSGQWHMVCAWWDKVANTINIEVNASGVDSEFFSANSLQSNTKAFSMGARNPSTGGGGFNGRIAYAAVWNRPLTSEERRGMYNAGLGLQVPFTTFIVQNDGTPTIGAFLPSKTPSDATPSGFVGGYLFAARQFGPSGVPGGQVPRIGGFVFSPRSWPVENPNTAGSSSGLSSIGDTTTLCGHWPFNEASGAVREDITQNDNTNLSLYPWPWKGEWLGDKASLNTGLSGFWPCDEFIRWPRADVIATNHTVSTSPNVHEKRVITTGGHVSGAYCSRAQGTFLEDTSPDPANELNPGSGDFTIAYWFKYDVLESTLFHGHFGKWTQASPADQRAWAAYVSNTTTSILGARVRPLFRLTTDGLALNAEEWTSPNSNHLWVGPSGADDGNEGTAPRIENGVPYFVAARYYGASGVADITWASGSEVGGTWESRFHNISDPKASFATSGVFESSAPITIGNVEFTTNRLPRATLGNVGAWHRALSDDEIQTLWGSGLGQQIPYKTGALSEGADPLGPGADTADPKLGTAAIAFDDNQNLGFGNNGAEHLHMEHGRGGEEFAFDGTTSFTWCGWVKFGNTFSQVIFQKGSDNTGQRSYKLQRNNNDGRIEWYMSNSAGTAYTSIDISTSFTSAGTWYFFCVGWNKEAGVMFGRLNGQALVTTAQGAGFNVGEGPFTVGNGTNGGSSHSPMQVGSSIDSLYLFKRVLTEDEIDFIYNTGTGLELEESDLNAVFDLAFLGYDQPGNSIGGHLFSKPRIDQRNNNFIGAYTKAPGFTNEKRIGAFLLAQPLQSAPTSFIGGSASGAFQFGPGEELQGEPRIGGWIFGRPDSTQFAEQHSRTLVKARSEDVVDQGLNIDNQLILFQRENANFYGRLQTESTDFSDFHAKLAVESFRERPTSEVTVSAITDASGVTEVEVCASGIPGEVGTFFTFGEIDFGEPYRTLAGASGTTTPGGVAYPTVSGSVSGFDFFKLNPTPVGSSGTWQMCAKHVYDHPGEYIITTKFIDNLGMVHMRGFALDLLGAGSIESLPTEPTKAIDFPGVDISGLPRLGNVPPSLLVDFNMRASGLSVEKIFPERDAVVTNYNKNNPGTNNFLQWNFGNGSVTTTKRPFAYYTNPGFYVPVFRYQFKHPSGTLIDPSGRVISPSGGPPGGSGAVLGPQYGPKSIWLSESLLIGFNT